MILPQFANCFSIYRLKKLTNQRGTLLLVLFAQPQILASSVFLGWAGGPLGRDPFNTLDLCSGTPFLPQAFVFTLFF